MKKHLVGTATALLALAWAACTNSTELQLRGGVHVSFSTQPPVTATPAAPALRSPAAALSDTVASGSDTIVVSSVSIVLRKIELEPTDAAGACALTSGGECQEVAVGPVLIDLPLAPGVKRNFSVEIASGAYGKADFEIHKVSGDDPVDAQFINQHPEMADLSIRVAGTYNGQAFTYTTDLDTEQELQLSPPLVVSDTGTTNLTIFVDLDGWFRTAGGALVDPATANKGGLNEGLVKENIKSSMDAFEDRDEDGSKGNG